MGWSKLQKSIIKEKVRIVLELVKGVQGGLQIISNHET